MKSKVAVLFGGYSSEKIVAEKSAQTIMENIDSSKYDVYAVEISEKDWTVNINSTNYFIDKNDFSIHFENTKIKFDLAYITIHGTPGENGKLQGYFDMIGLPYTGCGQFAASLTFNKWACNHLLRNLKIPVAQSLLFRKNDEINEKTIVEKLSLPIFIKPSTGGSSFGTSFVKTKQEIVAAINLALEHSSEVIVEEFLNGTEVTCGVYKTKKGDTIVLPATEIVSETEFFDYKAKYEGKSKEITPARIEDVIYQKIVSINKDLYSILNLNGVCRIDYMIVNETPYVIEINTIPGMSDHSIIPKQVNCVGIELTDFLNDVMFHATYSIH